MTRSSAGPLPRGEGARSAGEGQKPEVSSRGPHPAFGHPLPEGEGPRFNVSLIAGYIRTRRHWDMPRFAFVVLFLLLQTTSRSFTVEQILGFPSPDNLIASP